MRGIEARLTGKVGSNNGGRTKRGRVVVTRRAGVVVLLLLVVLLMLLLLLPRVLLRICEVEASEGVMNRVGGCHD